ncbi:IclR family acetate operon transcriptional repressor [Aurantimicrobium minutum]|nr:IclR family acetate operon transcriptional repressor [Aurantimicrobium minutum]
MEKYTVQSLDLGLRILQLMGTADVLTVRSAATSLGISTSAAHRALRTLEDRGFVSISSNSRGYVPGPYLMGMLMTPGIQPKTKFKLRPVIQAVREQTGESVHSAVLLGNQVLVVDGRRSNHPKDIGLRIGMTAPAHAMAAGKLLLAQLDQAQLRAILPNQTLPRRGPKTITNRDELEAELRRVRVGGVAYTIQESETGINSLALPLAGSNWRDRIALVISLPISRGKASRLRELAEISESIISSFGGEQAVTNKW